MGALHTLGDCPDPAPNDWPSDTIETAVSGEFFKTAGPAIDYLRKRAIHNDMVGERLSWMTGNQGTSADGALEFLRSTRRSRAPG